MATLEYWRDRRWVYKEIEPTKEGDLAAFMNLASGEIVVLREIAMEIEMNITERELDQLKEAKNEAEWNEAVDKLLEIRGGKYPPDWYEKVISADLKLQPGMDLDINITTINH